MTSTDYRQQRQRISPGQALAGLLVCLMLQFVVFVTPTPLRAETATELYSGVWGTCPWRIDANGLLTVSPGEGWGEPEWLQYSDSITKIRLRAEDGMKVILPPDSAWIFARCPNVTAMDLSGVDSSHVTDMSGMFVGLKSLYSLDVSAFDTSQVTDMTSMFADCSSLSELDVSGFDTSNVTSMHAMYSGCSALRSLNVESFETGNVVDMDQMFADCTRLASVDVSGWDVSSVERIGSDNAGSAGGVTGGMFSGCSSLQSLDVSDWDVSNVKDASNAFYGCTSLTDLDVSRWNTASIRYMAGMFSGCSSLQSIDVSRWVVRDCRAMGQFFHGCSSLEDLDLTGWDTSKVGYTDDLPYSEIPFFCDMEYMFEGCSSLDTIAVGERFNVDLSFPDATSPNEKWWSAGLHAWVTAPEIMETRVGIADTYTSEGPDEEPRDLSSATVSEIPEQSFTGFKHEPAVEVRLGKRLLEMDRDYAVAYANNIDAGWATVEIEGLGKYNGTIETGFVIAPVEITDTTIAAVPDATYTGKELSPVLKIAYGDYDLVQEKDYALSYQDNLNAGTAQVTITGRGNFVEATSTTFTIKKASIKKASVASISSQGFTGTEICPRPKISYNGKTLKEGLDYSLSYADNTKAGTATLTAKGIGNFTNSQAKSFTIKKTSISKAKIDSILPASYTGKAIKPNPTVRLGKFVLKKGTDYTVSYKNNVNVGTATLTVTGKGSLSGSQSVTFKINKASIAKAKVASVGAKTYSGSAFKPSPKVSLSGRTLKKGTDYTLSYKKNTNAGKATIVVAGKGNYGGTCTQTFTIKPKSLASGSVAAISNKAYTGSAIKPVPAIAVAKKKLKNGTDFTLAYANNMKLGKAVVTIKGKGNYTGSKKVTFKIVKANLSKATVASIGNQKHTGKAITPLPKVTLSKRTLKKDTDYTLSYKNNVNVGTATIVLTGKGNYTGTKSVTFKIVRAKRGWKPNSEGYRFENFSTGFLGIPLEFCVRMFGSFGEEVYWWDMGNGGCCYGFASTSAASKAYSYPAATSYTSGSNKAKTLYDVDLKWKSSTTKLTARDYILYGQIAQADPALQNELQRNAIEKKNAADLAKFKAVVSSAEYSGCPITLCIFCPDEGGHALWAMGVKSDTKTRTTMLIYDSNWPGENRELVMYKNSAGRYTGWQYELAPGMVWGTTHSSQDWLSWSTPANDLKSMLARNGKYKESTYQRLYRSSSDVTVVSNGKEYLLSKENTEDLDMILPVLEMKGPNDASASQGGGLFWSNLPSEVGFIDIEEDTTVSVSSSSGGATASVTAGSEVIINVSDEDLNSVDVWQSRGAEFEVTYFEQDDETESEITRVTISGVGDRMISTSQVPEGFTVTGAESLTVESNGITEVFASLDVGTTYAIVPHGDEDPPEIKRVE